MQWAQTKLRVYDFISLGSESALGLVYTCRIHIVRWVREEQASSAPDNSSVSHSLSNQSLPGCRNNKCPSELICNAEDYSSVWRHLRPVSLAEIDDVPFSYCERHESARVYLFTFGIAINTKLRSSVSFCWT